MPRNLEIFQSFYRGFNKHYPDVSDFHGDPTKWEAWQLHLDAKFRASARLFPTEQSRIDYIRDHCKSIAFDIIKTRCRIGNENPYTTAHEILEDLDNIHFARPGKSVLCSTAIHATPKIPNVGIVFIYFTINDESKQDVSALRPLRLKKSTQKARFFTSACSVMLALTKSGP